MKKEIEEILQKQFQIDFLEVTNNSHLHARHMGDNGSGNTHFKIEIKAKELAGLSKINAHRAVNKLMNPLFEKGLHALEIKIK
jgi:BolA protein